MAKKLTQEQKDELNCALSDCYARDSGESWRNGSHYLLIHLLNRFGIHVSSSRQAEREAEKLLESR